MSYVITNQCIDCERCYHLPCPVGAIQKANGLLFIDSTLCNDCVGYHGTPQCASVCPTNAGCIPRLTVTDDQYSHHSQSNGSTYWDSWFVRYNDLMRRLKANSNNQYWQHWFDTYSDKLTSLLTQSLGLTK